MNDVRNLLDLGLEHVVIVIFTVAYAVQASLKVYEWFCVRFGIQTKWSINKNKYVTMLESHDGRLTELENGLSTILEALQKHMQQDDERAIATFRSTLYRLHSEFITQGYVTQEGLKTFLEAGRVYQSAGGDDIYHSKLEPEVLKLPLRESDDPS